MKRKGETNAMFFKKLSQACLSAGMWYILCNLAALEERNQIPTQIRQALLLWAWGTGSEIKCFTCIVLVVPNLPGDL